MGTTVHYGAVQIHNVTTRQWEQEMVYDESRTDVLFHRFRLRFEGIVHAGGFPSAGPWAARGAGQGSAPENYAEIRSLLGQARLPLVVAATDAGGVERILLTALPLGMAPGAADMDVENGPKPTGLAITHIAGANCFRVSFAVECAKLECTRATGTSAVPFVLNNRWSVSEAMDEAKFIERTIEGQMQLSAPVAVLGSDFRGLVVPGLERGFRRARAEIHVDPSGLTIRYRVTDRQVHTAAPWPAEKMEVTHTEEIQGETAFFSDVSVRLEGSPAADRRLLILRAVQILEARLAFLANRRTPEKKAGYFIESIVISEHLGDQNLVEARARIMRTPLADKNVDLGGFYAALRAVQGADLELPPVEGEPARYDSRISSTPPLYGYEPQGGERRPIVLWFLHCYLQHPCVDRHGIAQATPGVSTDESEGSELPTHIVEREIHTLSADVGNEFSDAADETVYTMARMVSIYDTDDLTVALPLARGQDAERSKATVSFIRLAPSLVRRIIEFDCEAAGDWPHIPKPVKAYQDGEVNAVRTACRVSPQGPSLAADGRTPICRVSGRYVYHLDREPDPEQKLRVGTLPYTKYVPEKTAFDPKRAFNEQVGP